MTEVAERIRAALRAAADPARAAGQQAYMKSAMPFLGVPVPEARRCVRSACRGVPDADVLLSSAADLWRNAQYREEWYAALAVLGLRPLRGDLRMVALVEEAVRTARWWDITDECAHRVADLLDLHPAATALLVRRWRTDDDLWMRRLAIISQLGRRDRTDLDLLSEAIEPNLADPDFFIRKAIGWALRELARTDPDWVRAFAAAHELSPLSRREALKHLD